MERISQPVLAGILTALVGFTSSSAVVLTGLRAVGATPSEAASGLLAVCATQGIGILWLVRRHRIPLTLAWSTPGAALLASTGVVRGGWPAAVGAFLVVGGLILVTGLWPRLGALITAIPTSIAQAMLAGVVLELCLDPVPVSAPTRGWSGRSCSPGSCCSGSRARGPSRPRSRSRCWSSASTPPGTAAFTAPSSRTWTGRRPRSPGRGCLAWRCRSMSSPWPGRTSPGWPSWLRTGTRCHGARRWPSPASGPRPGRWGRARH